jgi:hypothetical protein
MDAANGTVYATGWKDSHSFGDHYTGVVLLQKEIKGGAPRGTTLDPAGPCVRLC